MNLSVRWMRRCVKSCAAGCVSCMKKLKFTSVFVTHDQEEAMEVADRVAVDERCNIEQADARSAYGVSRLPVSCWSLWGSERAGGHPRWTVPRRRPPLAVQAIPGIPGEWTCSCADGKWTSAADQPDSPLPVQVLEASPKGHYTQLVVQPLGGMTNR